MINRIFLTVDNIVFLSRAIKNQNQNLLKIKKNKKTPI